MSQKSIIIIGAGLAGLAAGCYARMNGYRTHIFEHHTQPGGVCTAWKRQGYTIDGCIHWLVSSKSGAGLYQICRELAILEGLRLVPLDCYARFTVEASQQSLDVTADLNRLESDMKAIAPQDSQVISEMLKGIHAVHGVSLSSSTLRELASPLDRLGQIWRMRRVLRYVIRGNVSTAEFAKRIQNPFLHWMVTYFFTPEAPVFGLFILLERLASGELAVLEGGSLALSDALAGRYQNLGGELTCGATVEKILVEQDRAVGVRLADGSEHRADIVISAADGYSTIFQMLGGRYIDQKIRSLYGTWPVSPALLIASFGVARQFPGERAEHIVRLQRPITIGSQQIDVLWFRIFNYDPSLAPAGKTVVQGLMATDFDYWYELQKDDLRYTAEKERVAGEILNRLELHLPGITADVEMTDVATPYTAWRYTRNYRAAPMGWTMTPKMLTTRVARTLPGLDDLYMAGQWVEIGGGAGVVMNSGRQIVQLICHQNGQPFRTSTAHQP
jgi:phytoene desaturase